MNLYERDARCFTRSCTLFWAPTADRPPYIARHIPSYTDCSHNRDTRTRRIVKSEADDWTIRLCAQFEVRSTPLSRSNTRETEPLESCGGGGKKLEDLGPHQGENHGQLIRSTLLILAAQRVALRPPWSSLMRSIPPWDQEALNCSRLSTTRIIPSSPISVHARNG